jgi:hypothetical protein
MIALIINLRGLLMNRTIRVMMCLLSLNVAISNAYANSASTDLSSEMIRASTALVTEGSIAIISNGGNLIVNSVKAGADFTVLVLRDSVKAAELSVRIPTQVLGGASVAAGASVEAVSTATGIILKNAGKIIAFLPNEVGKQLLRSSESK